MTLEILNSTGSSVTLGGTTYANGSYVSITSYVAFNGVKYTRNDVDGPNAGRNLAGTMIRDRVATKDKLEITLIPLIASDLAAIMALIYPQSITVKYTSPRQGAVVTKTMYSNNIPATFCIKRSDGTEYWSGVSIPLVEL